MNRLAPVGIFGGGPGVAPALAAGLMDQGHSVAILCPTSACDDTADALGVLGASSGVVIGFDGDDGASVAAALDSAGSVLGTLVGAVDATSAGEVAVPGQLTDLDCDAWARRTEVPLRQALHRMQGSHRYLSRSGGHIVVLVPSLALTGAAGLVAWVSAAEGHRALAKAAARAWGASAVTVNCLAVPAEMVADGLELTDRGLDRPGLPPPSLGGVPNARAELAGVVSHLVGANRPVLTGQTVAVDGGVWMTP